MFVTVQLNQSSSGRCPANHDTMHMTYMIMQGHGQKVPSSRGEQRSGCGIAVHGPCSMDSIICNRRL